MSRVARTNTWQPTAQGSIHPPPSHLLDHAGHILQQAPVLLLLLLVCCLLWLADGHKLLHPADPVGTDESRETKKGRNMQYRCEQYDNVKHDKSGDRSGRDA